MAVTHNILHARKVNRNGTEKTVWVEIGFVAQGQSGKYFGTINAIPIDWDGSFILKDREARGGQQQEQAPVESDVG